MRFDLAAADVVAKLTAAGLPATVDPRDLDPPAIWVQLADLDVRRFQEGHYLATFNLTAIAPDTGTSQALATLGALSERLCATFTTITGGTTLGIVLPGGPDPMPAIQYQVALICTDEPATPPRK